MSDINLSGNLNFDNGNGNTEYLNNTIEARINSSAPSYRRPALNFIGGSGVGLTISDDSVDNEVDITITSTNTTFTGAPINASYVVLGTDATLTNEKVLTAGSNISISSGANTVTISANSVTTGDLTSTSPLFVATGTGRLVGGNSNITLSGSNVSANSNKISLSGSFTGSVLAPFSIDVNESNLTLDNMIGPLSIAKGGTGTGDKASAFNALSPAISQGALVTRNATNNVQLTIGTQNQFLMVDSGASTLNKWGTIAAGSNVTIDTSSTGITINSSGGGTVTTGSITGNIRLLVTGTGTVVGSSIALDVSTGSLSANLPITVSGTGRLIGPTGLVLSINSGSITSTAPLNISGTGTAMGSNIALSISSGAITASSPLNITGTGVVLGSSVALTVTTGDITTSTPGVTIGTGVGRNVGGNTTVNVDLASSTGHGLVSTGTQLLAGIKTFLSTIIGRGNVQIQSGNALQLVDQANFWSSFFRASTGMAADINYTLPPTVGSSGQVLTTNGVGNLNWISATTGGTASPLTTAGDSYVYDTGNQRLPIGTPNQFLMVDTGSSTRQRWANIVAGTNITITNSSTGITISAAGGTGGSVSPLTTKGDVYTYDTGNQRLPIGTQNQILMVDSGTATGNRWASLVAGTNITLNNTTTGISISSSASGSGTTGNLTTTTAGVTIGNGVGSVNGTGTTVNIASASASSHGLMTTGFQTFAGSKFFNATIGTNQGAYIGFASLNGPQGVYLAGATGMSADVYYTLPRTDGTLNQVLTTNGTGNLTWTTPAGSSPLTTAGDNYVYDTGNQRLPIGTSNQFLMVNTGVGTKQQWANIVAGTNVTINPSSTGITINSTAGGAVNTTKGDIATYDTGNNRLPIGTQNQFLMVDSGSATGNRWVTIASGSNITITNTSTGISISSTGGGSTDPTTASTYTLFDDFTGPNYNTSTTLPAASQDKQQVLSKQYSGFNGTLDLNSYPSCVLISRSITSGGSVYYGHHQNMFSPSGLSSGNTSGLTGVTNEFRFRLLRESQVNSQHTLRAGWGQATNVTTNWTIVGTGSTTDGVWLDLNPAINSNQVVFHVRRGASETTVNCTHTALSTGTWYRLKLDWVFGSSVTAYLDGSSIGTTSTMTNEPNISAFLQPLVGLAVDVVGTGTNTGTLLLDWFKSDTNVTRT